MRVRRENISFVHSCMHLHARETVREKKEKGGKGGNVGEEQKMGKRGELKLRKKKILPSWKKILSSAHTSRRAQKSEKGVKAK